MSAQRTALIVAGGTGGHIMPGLAVADVLVSRGWRVKWMGHPEKMEGRLVPAHGIEMAPLRFSGVRGKGPITLLKLPFLLLGAFGQAWKQLAGVRPDVILGMGGYVAFPAGVMGVLRGVPLVLHEQNAVAGMTNRGLAMIASRRLSGFPGVLRGADVVGNPVRNDLADMPLPATRYAGREGPLRLLVVGGSLGAQALNTTVPQALAKLPAGARPVVVHQAGEQHIQALREAYASAGVEADCRPFIDDMATELGQADLLICRAGAMTVAEVAAVGVAALFIPFPHAVDDHQTANARHLSESDAAWVRQQSELSADWLATWLGDRQRAELQAVAERARAHALPDAAARIADVCEQAARYPS
ncbi:UDP-N-acetylglucosamine--N-acetylmuramyl-(pentapeptide) pyrophosphoryl-undecaprenol N-acetylglucosamine transferase [plant metagenome]|uniref:UDP-N-acetylglucosamine--N-acetylmuramyl-(pentapeptide) pyrophosphoryl-undecaprenol N-acetylglucosamine transferase n=2 Tax=root TaxID=1 RepID=A0A1C3JX23_9BURK|nr:undecaprenyldiphospho-muramoylpentapeptide beta-N-acetylglucosaminyltransferase [Orrella dioscoreae]SBT23668.1 UDP-N-acetylglucosamine--N-acetylmuramyl-(pentapeptide) pyrophosphoryl-undecaprenol N-acetylglucosamine transferase [Orrella dioscoreae]SOE47618.1 UDP-N-acetylglucosamine--N-acetylmuramyl-(pentap e ptide) pyrophosphoryl-undecaprenol N-acetylglucosamine transferase [Orrella dioscoreae]